MTHTSNDELDQHIAYWAQLGRLVDTLGHLQDQLFGFISGLSGLPYLEQKDQFGGQSFDRLTSRVRETYKERGEKIPEILDRAFQRLAEILAIRNQLLHYGACYRGDDTFRSASAQKRPDKWSELCVTAGDLENAANDLRIIDAAIVHCKLRYGSRSAAEYLAMAQLPWHGKLPKVKLRGRRRLRSRGG